MKKKFRITMLMVASLLLIQIPLFTSAQNLKSVEGVKVASETEKETKSIVDIAVKDGRFKTLTAALQAADLVDTLKGKGPFTVFAPTDEAFAKLPKETLEDLVKPENKEVLKDILTYHVYPGKVLVDDALKLDGKEIEMVNGKKAKIEVKDGLVYINGAKVIITDIVGDNGVIHVIDTVILPQ